MLSIQDEHLVPAPLRGLSCPGNPKGSVWWLYTTNTLLKDQLRRFDVSLVVQILAALDIVRQGADVVPRSQLNQVLDSELGTDWTSKLASFDYTPMAAASLGQVHRAVTKDGLQVPMKIQYPGVADSIESDIDNVQLLLEYANLIPERLFLHRAMKVAKEELSRECDCELETMNQKSFQDLLFGKYGFYVPMVLDHISSKRVLTAELVSAVPIDRVAPLDERTCNYVDGELFVFSFMQTHMYKQALLLCYHSLSVLVLTSEEEHHSQRFSLGSDGVERHRLTPPPDEAYTVFIRSFGELSWLA
ncbi:hypothetical protein MLD38_009055 [Melastoma candidum]|uniref:Uncharacterized protein n=1 Tax=Melastoma candidum TaxID=119954 RepID=A0ACB9RVZ1_9MYRT|nr:hypothetical protein MLD38_009055 [Melastoma candidum]